jgi:pimeloyl-ACP methyl ester carboxylesterase
MTGKTPYPLILILALFSLSGCGSESTPTAVPDTAVNKSGEIKHGYADSNGVKIHYVETGDGPLVVMIHGFPDFWYTWRHQMDGMKESYRVVAIDQRGYNLSDQPEGVENYDMSLLVSDVLAVIRHLGEEKAIVVGHDWGGVVAWNVAFFAPDMVDKLVILNLPHPNGIAQAMRNNPEVLAGTTYARNFREGTPNDPEIIRGYPMTSQTLSAWVADEGARSKYIEAFDRSDFTAMLNYYKRNYPDVWSGDDIDWPTAPNIAISTLVIHGLDDTALHSDGLNNTWDWIDSDLTIVTVPDAGHFVQQDAAELVTTTMRSWLDDRRD